MTEPDVNLYSLRAEMITTVLVFSGLLVSTPPVDGGPLYASLFCVLYAVSCAGPVAAVNSLCRKEALGFCTIVWLLHGATTILWILALSQAPNFGLSLLITGIGMSLHFVYSVVCLCRMAWRPWTKSNSLEKAILVFTTFHSLVVGTWVLFIWH